MNTLIHEFGEELIQSITTTLEQCLPTKGSDRTLKMTLCKRPKPKDYEDLLR